MNRAQGNSVGLKRALIHDGRSSRTPHQLRSMLSVHTADTLHLVSTVTPWGSARCPVTFAVFPKTEPKDEIGFRVETTGLQLTLRSYSSTETPWRHLIRIQEPWRKPWTTSLAPGCFRFA